MAALFVRMRSESVEGKGTIGRMSKVREITRLGRQAERRIERTKEIRKK